MEEKKEILAARHFLRNGRSDDVGDDVLALACNQIIQQAAHQSLKTAVRLARQFAERSKGREGIGLRLTAARAMARMLHQSGSHLEALTWYLKARRLCRSDAVSKARIDRALVDVYMYLGRPADSRRAAERAIQTFARLQADDDLIRTRVNLANLLHRQDRHREAERLYREAAAYFAEHGDDLARARCLYNQANTLVQLFDLDTATVMYGEAKRIYDSAGHMLEGCDAQYGLAWLSMLKGEFHSALLDLSACQKIYEKAGDRRGAALCTIDRAEVYLGLGLYGDAYDAARRAELLFARLGIPYEQAKAAIFRGQAALALGKKNESRGCLARAKSGFSAEKNNGFIGVVHLTESEMLPIGSQRLRAVRSARALFDRAQLPYWEALCDLHLFASGSRQKETVNRLARNRSIRHVPHLYALWQTALGDHCAKSGRIKEAQRHWRQAADRLDAVRASLPPVELRSAFGYSHQSSHRHLIASTMKENPAMAAAWVERFQTAGIWAPLDLASESDPQRQEIMHKLNLLAGEVGLMSRSIGGGSSLRGFSPTSSPRLLTSLQHQVREHFAAAERHQTGLAVDPERLARELRDASHHLPIIQFYMNGDQISAFVHDQGLIRVAQIQDGRIQLVQTLERWRFILEGELIAALDNQSLNPETELSLWRELGEWLWGALALAPRHNRILIIPQGELANIPWPALIVDGAPLMERHHIILAPSLRHYLAAQARRVNSDRVEIFRGTSHDLPLIDIELSSLIASAGDRVRVHHPAARESWPSEGEAEVWHFSGHANLRADNPFYSFLDLENAPLFAADFRLKSCRVNLVTLAACRSGEEIALPGEESGGLVRALLEMGARNVIAGRWPVWDRSTALWMGAFYDKLFNDHDILNAVRHASLAVRKSYPSAYHWAAFALFGAGDLGGPYEA